MQRRHSGGRRDLGEEGAKEKGGKEWSLMGSFGGMEDREDVKVDVEVGA